MIEVKKEAGFGIWVEVWVNNFSRPETRMDTSVVFWRKVCPLFKRLILLQSGSRRPENRANTRSHQFRLS
jgi:hypothetical protein